MSLASREPLHPAARELPPPEGGLASYPPVERWSDWEEYDPIAWPEKVKRRYELIPTICCNCEADSARLRSVISSATPATRYTPPISLRTGKPRSWIQRIVPSGRTTLYSIS